MKSGDDAKGSVDLSMKVNCLSESDCFITTQSASNAVVEQRMADGRWHLARLKHAILKFARTKRPLSCARGRSCRDPAVLKSD